MLLLLDTHIFLWFITGDSRLSVSFHEAILESENRVFLSAASLWEIIIKYDLRKLPLPESPESFIPRQRKLHGIESLPVTESSFKHLASLPNKHRDPFDRCLISQALSHKMTIVTMDRAIMEYEVEFLKQ